MILAQTELRGWKILIAAANIYFSAVIFGMLKSFGADRIVRVRDWYGVAQILNGQKVDILICDLMLPPVGGIELTRCIRLTANSEFHTIPIVLTTADTRLGTIKQARGCGVSMVIAKPMSPRCLYDRLAWPAFNPSRHFDEVHCFDSDERSRSAGSSKDSAGNGENLTVENGDDIAPSLRQDEVDSLFNSAIKQ